MTRTAIVRNAPAETVAAYLPGNYTVIRTSGSDTLISGEDVAGWTLDGYVIPRLASGLYFAEEITNEKEQS